MTTWFTKSARAQSVTDDKSWKRGGGVSPTLNAFDNNSETRATVLAAFDTQFGSNANVFEEVSPTLKSSQQPPSVQTEATTGVRRLTPKECERLQGFPDDWTAGQPDAARYRQMGNAVAVPVVEWIIRRLVEVDKC